jgi:hypothetical protein
VGDHEKAALFGTPEDCPRLIPLGSARSSTSRLPSPARRQDPGTRGDHPERVTQPRTATHGQQAGKSQRHARVSECRPALARNHALLDLSAGVPTAGLLERGVALATTGRNGQIRGSSRLYARMVRKGCHR